MLKITLTLGRFDELPGGDPSQAIELARMADDTGIYGLSLGDHLVLGTRLDRYPYATGFRHPEGPRTPYLEPVAVLGAFAAATSNVRLSTSILVAPLRPAVLLAKQLATLDVLSKGRCEPSFGFGWQPEEYEAVGVDWSSRRQVFRDSIGACRALWGGQPAAFTSPTVKFEGLFAMPQPVQARIPILCGVKLNESSVALIAELCDGWDPASYTREELRGGTDALRSAFIDVGRDPETLIIRAHIGARTSESGQIDLQKSFQRVDQLLDCGANQISLQIPVGYGAMFESMAEVGHFLSAVGRMAGNY